MRTLKQKIKSWKVIAVAMVIPVVFFVVSCQDQAETPQYKQKDGREPLPQKVQHALDRLKEENPKSEFIVVQPSGHNPKDFEGKHAKHISVIDGETVFEASSVTVIETGKDENGNSLKYMILHYSTPKPMLLPTEKEWKEATGEVREESVELIDGEPIFYAVEKQAEAPGGIDGLKSRLDKKAQYPAQSKRNGVEGRVFIKFIVKKDGTLTNFEIIKGINQELDLEALRLLKTEGQWKPGMQNGKAVNSQFVIPIEFKLH